MTTLYKIRVDGSNLIDIAAEIAESDELLKATIGAAMPELANATIQRCPEQDGVVVIELVKRAADKGNGAPLGHLTACEGGVNPALTLWQRLAGDDPDIGTLMPEDVLALNAEIEQALEAGARDAGRMTAAVGRLTYARPAAAGLPVVM